MGKHLLVVMATIAGLLAGAAPAGAATVGTDDLLTSATRLDGTATFATPSGWHQRNASPRPDTARFSVEGAGTCDVQVSVSIRGVATSASPAAQVRRAVHDAPLGGGVTDGVAWGVRSFPIGGSYDGSYKASLYGISPRRAASRRWGQLRVVAVADGCPAISPAASATFAPGSTLVAQVAHLLARTRTELRVHRTRT